MKFTQFSLMLTILRALNYMGAIEGINIADIVDEYDLKPGSPLEIHTISADNKISNGRKSYSLDDANPVSVFTNDATYMFNGVKQPLPEPRLSYKQIGDEFILISMAKNGSTNRVSIYSNTGELGVQYEKVGENQFVPISSDSVDYEVLNEKFSYGNSGPDTKRNLENTFSPHKSIFKKTQGACTSFKVVELAVAWESSFCSQSGSKDEADQKAIQIVAGVSVKYQQTGLCTKIKISHMEGYCNPSTDPYKQMVDLNQSGCGTPGLLQGFVNYWNDNRSSINRDVAQLFSGTGLECSGGRCVIGCAYIGQLCNSFSYGVNYATFSGNANSVEVLVAHELGHNCGAQHYNIQDHIMFPSVNPSGQGFSQTSVNSFLDLFSRSPCIGVEATESPASASPVSEPSASPSTSPVSEPSTSPSTSPTITGEPDSDICTTGTSKKSCGTIGCVWKNGECMMCSTLNKNKKKCSKAGCNWVEDDQDTCQSCNKGANRLECNEMSCVWEGNIKNIGKMCTPCTAIKDASKKTCKKAGCAFKKKCVSCLTKPNKKKCKKQKGCAWSGTQCSMDLSSLSDSLQKIPNEGVH